ncbi:hypothetical protein F4802DRAFT_547868 [Xylaria palmicola]|nr:hypothetical protein F4802DRAFT_547868 [Xylaria palmicola]
MQRLGTQGRTRLWKLRFYPRPPPTRDTSYTLDISDLILDLDAFDAKGVRPFDPALDGVPKENGVPKKNGRAWRERELRHVRSLVARFENKDRECASSVKSLSGEKFNPLHINDFDVISLALLGSSNVQRTAAAPSSDGSSADSYATVLDSVLQRNGIPDAVRSDTSNTMAYLLHRYLSISPDPSLRLADSKSLATAFTGNMAFPEIERLAARMTQTHEGSRILSILSDKLYHSLRIDPRAPPIQLLSFLNNLLVKLDQHKLKLSPKLYELGIRTSLECQAIATTRQYLERRLTYGSPKDNLVNSILDKLLQTSITSSTSIPHAVQTDISSRLTMVFSLLTGYVPGEGQPAVSLRSLVNRELPHGFHLYIKCLARLGAYRTIWHEWHRTDFGSRGIGSGTQQESASSTEEGHFVAAILEALRQNHRMKEIAGLPVFANVTGNFQEDCQRDMVCISRSADILALPAKSVDSPDASPTHAGQGEQLRQIFRQERIETAIPALQEFLARTTSF